ncbi:Ig-like domain-containing protein [Rathayibacter sp. VKM Ac-2835]|uniref:Ig-like domain-containing protein n=1 Tax=Rathayibacter sp. VKM Ac-2835 TaxID=2739043 RepID=UPI0015679CF0|nr:Ig-like domain-containing protein [Rathayibacter sp. VKM Ac-2835]NRG42558.1 Ig-like domain-containing protein [Rathayibacter sp. VKM Ac-2835]
MARATPPRSSPRSRARTVLARLLAITAAVGIAVTATVIQDAPAASAAVASTTFGPDGTHYPSDTPDIRSALPRGTTVVDVAASGPAIRTALDALTARQIAGGAVLRVAPGRLVDVSALDGYTNDGAVKVLITARDGFRSVTGGDWALRGVTGITLMRFDIHSLDVKGATHASFAWLRVAANWVGLAGSAGLPVRDVELIEVVEPDSTVKNADSAQIKAYAPDLLTDVLVEGGYIAPSYYVDAKYGGSREPRPHTDTLQIEGSGVTGQVTLRDTVVFASNNSAVIIGGVRNVAFDEAFIVGGSTAAQRYPFLKGGAGSAGAQNGPGSLSAVQGSGGGNVDASDSTFVGSLQPTWDAVSNTRTNLPGKTARSGGFTVDPSLGSMTAADLDARSPRPTTAYLAGIWDDVSLGGSPAPAPTSTPTATAAPAPTPSAPTSPAPAPTTEPTEPEEPAEPETPAEDTTAPEVVITAPEAGDVLGGPATATVTATDDVAVTGVVFAVEGIEIGDGVQTGENTWSLSSDTAGVQGTFALTARATDAAGNVTESAPVPVTLQ